MLLLLLLLLVFEHSELLLSCYRLLQWTSGALFRVFRCYLRSAAHARRDIRRAVEKRHIARLLDVVAAAGYNSSAV